MQRVRRAIRDLVVLIVIASAVRLLGCSDSVQQANRTHCVRSPKAVSPKLRGTTRDTKMYTHTTAHTTAVHFLAY